MDKGVHHFRHGPQVHALRDLRWSGPNAVMDEEHVGYAPRLVAAYRNIALDAVAITAHRCMAALPFIRCAAAEEMAHDGSPMDAEATETLNDRELAERSITEQVAVIRSSLPGLSDDNREKRRGAS